jgi:hypothetical protein
LATYHEIDDLFSSSLINTYSISTSSGTSTFSITFIPNLDVWGAGLSTESTTVKINIAMWWRKGSTQVRVNSNSDTSWEFDLMILPLSKLLAQMIAGTGFTQTVNAGAADANYVGTAISVSPPTISKSTAPSTNTYSNTFPTSLMDKLTTYLKL